MKRLFLRLDDACPKRDIDKWNRMEKLLDQYGIKPLVGIIPDCKDPDMDEYPEDHDFWTQRVPSWKAKDWTLAMHGYQHLFCTNSGGVNPVNQRSEFAGLPLEQQKVRISQGVSILRSHGIDPKVFFAPAHTFDENTLEALRSESNITVISDTPASDCYLKNGFTFVPLQSGRVRELPFKTVTFCYHPNSLTRNDFDVLEMYVRNHHFSAFACNGVERTMSFYDNALMQAYYWKHKSKRYSGRK